ncbi:MAG: hypothetical protein LBS68_02630 [Puniceicoccales bacterium]|jgi:hypothetical protein|nr:hypothetical protein [Puniceicoccales bacterium]
MSVVVVQLYFLVLGALFVVLERGCRIRAATLTFAVILQGFAIVCLALFPSIPSVRLAYLLALLGPVAFFPFTFPLRDFAVDGAGVCRRIFFRSIYAVLLLLGNPMIAGLSRSVSALALFTVLCQTLLLHNEAFFWRKIEALLGAQLALLVGFFAAFPGIPFFIIPGVLYLILTAFFLQALVPVRMTSTIYDLRGSCGKNGSRSFCIAAVLLASVFSPTLVLVLSLFPALALLGFRTLPLILTATAMVQLTAVLRTIALLFSAPPAVVPGNFEENRQKNFPQFLSMVGVLVLLAIFLATAIRGPFRILR